MEMTYPCGASAVGEVDLPNACPVHGVDCSRVEPAGASEPPSNMGIDWDYERSRCWSQPKVPPAPVSPVAPEPPTEKPPYHCEQCGNLVQWNHICPCRSGAPAPCVWRLTVGALGSWVQPSCHDGVFPAPWGTERAKACHLCGSPLKLEHRPEGSTR